MVDARGGWRPKSGIQDDRQNAPRGQQKKDGGRGRVVDLGPSMWRELCARSDTKKKRGVVDLEFHDRKEMVDAFKRARHIIPTNAEDSTDEYLFTLPPEALRRGVTAPGGPRMARFIDKLERGEPVVVVAMGGSNTAHGACWGPPACVKPVHPDRHGGSDEELLDLDDFGQPYNPHRPYQRRGDATRPDPVGMHDALDLRFQMRRFMQGINRTWPHPGHRFHNTAQPAKGTGYFNMCFYEYAPLSPAPDLVILEFGVNDSGPKGWEDLNRRVTSAWEKEPAVINLVTYNFCRADDGTDGINNQATRFSFPDCKKRLGETGWPPEDVPHGRAGEEYHNATGDMHEAVARFSLATGSTAVSSYTAIVPLMRAKRWPYWPPSLITTDGVHGDPSRLLAAPEESRGQCCVSLKKKNDEQDDNAHTETEYCASPPTYADVFRREEWGSPWTEDVLTEERVKIDKKMLQSIEMNFYNLALADMMLFPIFQARSEPRGAFLNDASWEETAHKVKVKEKEKEKKKEEDHGGGGGNETENRPQKWSRGDALRCLRWDVPFKGGAGVSILKNVHRRSMRIHPPRDADVAGQDDVDDDSVPERYLGNEELVAAWPEGNPDAPDAKGWIHTIHPLDLPPDRRKQVWKPGLVSVRVGDYLEMELSAASLGVGGTGDMEISYLTSYEHMGMARLTCISGCRCEPQLLNATSEKKVSVAGGTTFELRDGGDLAKCRMSLENVAKSDGGSVHENKFKLLSLNILSRSYE